MLAASHPTSRQIDVGALGGIHLCSDGPWPVLRQVRGEEEGPGFKGARHRHTYLHTCIHAYIHTYIHTYIHSTYIHTYIHTYYINAYIDYIRTTYTYILRTHIHTYIHTFSSPSTSQQYVVRASGDPTTSTRDRASQCKRSKLIISRSEPRPAR
jgi:hypothetical protein